MPWGNVSSKIQDQNKGFFKLDADEASPSKSRSFKDVLAGSTGDTLLSFTHSTFKGIPAVLILDDDVLKLASPFRFTLVGKFGVRRLNLDAIRSLFGNLKLSSFYSVGLLDSKHVAIQFLNDLDYSRIFARRSYFILNCQMRILKWTPFFDVKEESPIVSIWISFPNLRLHFFNPKVLHALGSIFGCPLQTDQATASRTRPSVVRVLVEVDITKKHAKEVWVGSKDLGYLQKVEFEKILDFCVHCKAHGHSVSKCFILHPKLKKTSNNSTGLVGNKAPVNDNPEIANTVTNVEVQSNVERTGNEPLKVPKSLVTPATSPVNILIVNDNIITENVEVPNIFISVDSMLNNSNSPLNLVIIENKDNALIKDCEEDGEGNSSAVSMGKGKNIEKEWLSKS
ncbi:hypothetical protein MA16_Dca027700 [Dendrobium catenatum]|uniref:DUF4283 domain-containing protein n=1 Tax=Dendrobium catenatum TaxID=906689 RepID=A0A2I0VAC2_9ASPA|nr:hypothetical protein MA16_Dca027700 [Dendrobium catenatum]